MKQKILNTDYSLLHTIFDGNMPVLYIIAGPNGAGKTTAVNELLPAVLQTTEFVNADNIARGISPFNPSSVDILAARVMLERVKELRKEKKDFVLETTLTSLFYRNMFLEMKKEGYNIFLIYLWLNNVELSIVRVADRVKNGGHNIPEEVIRRRFPKGLKNLEKIFIPIADSWQIFDNSEGLQIPIAQGEENVVKTVFNRDICNQILPHSL